MRQSRLIVFVILLSMVFGGWATAQDTEVTEEPAPEATEEPVVTTPAPEATDEPTTAPPTSSGGTHTVAAGETLYRIAVNNGTTVAILSQLNNISNPALIYTGQVLQLPTGSDVVVPPVTEEPAPEATEEPVVTTPAPEATEEPDGESSTSDEVEAGNSYVVQPGDSLFSIASSNNTTMAILQNLNNIANVNLIFAGQRLILPSDGTDSETANGSSTDSSEASSASADFGYGIQVYMNVSATAATASQISQLGVDWVKIDVSWADVEPVQGEYDYAALDTTVQVLDALGINILLNVYDAPAWSRENYVLNELLKLNSGPPEDFANFGLFMTNLTTRFSGVVDAYEIWKSPNLLRYWTVPKYATPPELLDTGDYGVPDEIQIGAIYYIDLLEIGYDAVKLADPNALVVSAGLAPVGSSDNYNFIATGTFLNNMLLLGGANYSDAVGSIFGASAVPPTALCCTQPPGVDSHYESFLQYFIEIVDFYHDIMERNDVGDMPLFITQVGWGTTEGGILASPSTGFEWLGYTSQDEQALYVTQAFEEAKKLGYVDGIFVSNLNGCSVGDSEACYFSLIDSNGAARPAFGALQNLDKSSPE
jgi:polysaccharide biosynthesis protein PslG